MSLTGPGTSLFEKLTVIDLRENRIPYLSKESFVSAVKLETLFLSKNHIQTIEVEAFKTIGKSLKRLILDDNELTTLKNGVFDGFVGTGRFLY